MAVHIILNMPHFSIRHVFVLSCRRRHRMCHSRHSCVWLSVSLVNKLPPSAKASRVLTVCLMPLQAFYVSHPTVMG